MKLRIKKHDDTVMVELEMNDDGSVGLYLIKGNTKARVLDIEDGGYLCLHSISETIAKEIGIKLDKDSSEMVVQ